jgi:hypothetical protein
MRNVTGKKVWHSRLKPSTCNVIHKYGFKPVTKTPLSPNWYNGRDHRMLTGKGAHLTKVDDVLAKILGG